MNNSLIVAGTVTLSTVFLATLAAAFPGMFTFMTSWNDFLWTIPIVIVLSCWSGRSLPDQAGRCEGVRQE